MEDKYRQQWEKLGADDPYWAVLTEPAMKDGKWNARDFFRTGENEIRQVMTSLSDLGLNPSRGVALDFGCGVGRLARALAGEFSKVIAVDISSAMLAEASKANQDIGNIEFIHNTRNDLTIIPENSVDFIYSNIVLQHLPANRQTLYIRAFCKVLSPGGVMVFQTPSTFELKSWMGWLYLLAGNKILNVLRRFRYGPSGVMEVHTLARKKVLATLQHEDVEVIAVERNDAAGPAFVSYMYFARKHSHS